MADKLTAGNVPKGGGIGKGTPGPGRPKGKPNRATVKAREVALAFLDRRSDEEIDALWEATKADSPKDAMRMWLQAQEFVLPKLGRTEHTGEDGGAIIVEIHKATKGPT